MSKSTCFLQGRGIPTPSGERHSCCPEREGELSEVTAEMEGQGRTAFCAFCSRERGDKISLSGCNGGMRRMGSPWHVHLTAPGKCRTSYLPVLGVMSQQ